MENLKVGGKTARRMREENEVEGNKARGDGRAGGDGRSRRMRWGFTFDFEDDMHRGRLSFLDKLTRDLVTRPS